MNQIQNEEQVGYNASSDTDNDLVQKAITYLSTRIVQLGSQYTNSKQIKEYAVLKLATAEREVFAVMFMTNCNQMIAYEELFYGTIDTASVHTREVAKAALKYNAAAVFLIHNHPSGKPEPSKADLQITKRLKEALQLFDIRVLDHIIVGGVTAISFVDQGLL